VPLGSAIAYVRRIAGRAAPAGGELRPCNESQAVERRDAVMTVQRLVIVLAIAAATPAFAAQTQAPAMPADEQRLERETERVSPRPRVEPLMSDRCYTVAANCILDDRQPRDSRCWCATPFGPSYGTVR
jgi:hypothetical protein